MPEAIKITPRWIIFFIDIAISLASFFLTYLIKYQLNDNVFVYYEFYRNCQIIAALSVVFFLLFRTFAGIMRLTETQDIFRILMAVLCINVSFYIISHISIYYSTGPLISAATLVVNIFVGFVLLVVYRLCVKFTFSYIKNFRLDNKRVVIYGAGEGGLLTKKNVERDKQLNYRVIAFIDDDETKINKMLDGVRIMRASLFEELIGDEMVDELIITIDHLSVERKNRIVDICLDNSIIVSYTPPVKEWINGQLSRQQIRKVSIEDLLERKPIFINNEKLEEQLHEKRIVVTGAAGSIGSEIARQLSRFAPQEIILVDIAESALYAIELELQETFPHINYRFLIADVRNEERLNQIFSNSKPHYVYHAAAYKHVPMMELNPLEAVATNVLGTKTVADLSIKHGVLKFVMISTDKAVNPTSVMGASKRIAEIYVQSLFNHHSQHTKFITTRFGNVLGSNGSVIPRFTAQIQQGGPVTITHPDICRYFMTIPEACQLVLEAGSMGNGGEIFVFDMGKKVKIIDMARKMIRLSGLRPDLDIAVKITGLRPGEKLHEELLNTEENTIPTYHEQILIAKVRQYDYNSVASDISGLIAQVSMLKTGMEIVKLMKRMVPEYVSNNSVFEKLDARP